MGFLDNLKDKAEEFGEKAKDMIGDVKDRFDGDDETAGDQPASQDKVQDAVDYSPESLEQASQEAPGAVDDATAAAEASATPATDPLDPVGPAGDPLDSVGPAGDPLDPVGPAGDPLDPAGPASDPLDPVDPVVESVDTDVRPLGEEDPLDGGPNRGPGTIS